MITVTVTMTTQVTQTSLVATGPESSMQEALILPSISRSPGEGLTGAHKSGHSHQAAGSPLPPHQSPQCALACGN